MERMMGWLRSRDHQMLMIANRRPAHRLLQAGLSRWLETITHMGGATFTLCTALCAAIAGSAAWSMAGWQCIAAVAVSHLPVAVMKRHFRRLRPYQKLPNITACRSPLQDSSFPSGHTTAIFAWLVPLIAAAGATAVLLLPAAIVVGLSVAWSRMYLGLHYPSDVFAGAMLGSATAVGMLELWPILL
ncbi:phosphatidylglycerophosphatase B [Paenibacillus sp. CCS19]|uniref:phosphatase PAP2 family protein n=1 Tax=Paenibacillus sp. CCS19 TaxID=3158387 RepID=UPI0025689AC2|nr:phosphatase PAP2 family protein [Paenibacillus cellulosilyticus]GMK39828.1 phosphatidylglycerophosphatase B [Paenibacillus cellulosilyticus]